ncbi:MAG: hypothetical protein AAF636_04910 [Pseudomonadota bacterium]
MEIYSGFLTNVLSYKHIVVFHFLALPAGALIGSRIGRIERRRLGYDKIPNDQLPGATTLGAMLALLGLLLGFAFNSAINWREDRQAALVDEANAIGTAFLTASLLEEPGQTALQEKILTYAQTRAPTQREMRNRDAFNAFLVQTIRAQGEIWPAALSAFASGTSDPIRSTVAQSLTNMLDTHNLRIAAGSQNIPLPAKLMISMAAVAAMMIVGNRSALHGRKLTWRTYAFAVLLAVLINVIYDLDRSQEGTMRIKTDTLRATIFDMEAMLAAKSL